MILSKSDRWSGVRYVNVGEGAHRCWTDMRTLGFTAAGHGRIYSDQLLRLSPGDEVYAYQKGCGYVGHGIVKTARAMARDIPIDALPLLDRELSEPNFAHSRDNPDLAEYACRVDWLDTVSLCEGRKFTGIFTSRHVVCRLRHEPTLTYLRTQFS